MLSYVALRQGDQVGLIHFADDIDCFVPPRGGMRQMNRLLHASFDRFPRLVETRYDHAFRYLNGHCRKRSLVVLITSIIDEVNAAEFDRYLSNLVGRHLPLAVLLRDHRLFDAVAQEQPDAQQLWRYAAAADIIAWRHQVLTDLHAQGRVVGGRLSRADDRPLGEPLPGDQGPALYCNGFAVAAPMPHDPQRPANPGDRAPKAAANREYPARRRSRASRNWNPCSPHRASRATRPGRRSCPRSPSAAQR